MIPHVERDPIAGSVDHSAPDAAFFARPARLLAPALIGVGLHVDGVGGLIVETEAYEPTDPASHSFNGETPRNRAMFGPAGHAYVYRSYGLHWCFNIVCGDGESGHAVLIRALKPTDGVAIMQARRHGRPLLDLCRGPGRLCQALGIGAAHDGLPLQAPPFRLATSSEAPEVAIGYRIGITKAPDRPWRFGWRGSPSLSRPFKA